MSETSTLIGYDGRTIGREELALVPTPPATGGTRRLHPSPQRLRQSWPEFWKHFQYYG